MNTIIDESNIASSIGNRIVLTNYRIYISDRKWGKFISMTIFLENICSIEFRSKSNLFVLVVSIFTLLVGGLLIISPAESISKLGMGVIALGLGLLLLWFTTRKRVVEVVSVGGTRISVSLGSNTDASIPDFINSVLLAKKTRLEEIHRFNN